MIRLGQLRTAAIYLAACALMLLVTAPRGFAQFSSGFTGIVVDQTGAVLPDAKVTVIDQATLITHVATSNESGNFRISSLASSEKKSTAVLKCSSRLGSLVNEASDARSAGCGGMTRISASPASTPCVVKTAATVRSCTVVAKESTPSLK